jgi:hypothetical protein
MERLRALGTGLAVLALAGYAAGVWIAYPGRAVSLVAFMIGVTLTAVGGKSRG